MRKTDPSFDKAIEKAVEFLVKAAPKESEKPVILHSIRVGLYLYERAYDKDIVTAGVLHDLLEESNTTYREIKKRFGDIIAKSVQANSFDKNIPGKTIKDKEKRYYQTLERCLKAGKQALIVKAADILDNSYYYHLAPDNNLHSWLLKKMKNFIKKSAPFIKNEVVWKELNKQYETITRKKFNGSQIKSEKPLFPRHVKRGRPV